MRHKVFGKKLNRDIKERKALFKNLMIALISHGKIKTSLAKAKAIQRLIEKLVTKIKEGTDVSYSQVSSFLTQKDAINKLIKEIAPRFKNISGGYTRVRRMGQRLGDATQEVIMEWSIAVEEKKVESKTKELEAKKEETASQDKETSAKKKPKKTKKSKK